MSSETPDETCKRTATEWLVRLQSPHLTEADKQQFFAWLNEKAEHQHAYIEAEALWESLGAVEQLPSNTAETLNKAESLVWYKRPQAIAASFMAFVALATIQFFPYNTGTDYQTDIGEQRQLTLADGSNIHLNTNSNLSVRLLGDSRKVEMTQGEAFFDVSHDPDRPFIIETPNGLVRVLGTSFNVHISDLETTVTVVEGKVGVAPQLQVDKQQAQMGHFMPNVLLTANEQINFSSNTIDERSTTLDAKTATSWRQGKQVYNGVPFVDVIDDLNRYFEGDLILADPALDNIEVVAVLNLRDKASAIAALESTFNVIAVNKTAELTELHPAN